MTHTTVLIATRNRPDPLRRCCESLARQRFRHGPRPTIDVVVADNTAGGTPGLDAAAVERWTGLPATVVRVDRPGIPVARNVALDHRHPAADCVVFIDDDETATPSWLDHLLAVARSCSADLVTGPTLQRLPDKSALGPSRWFALHRGGRAETGTVVPAAPTGNLLVASRFLERTALRFDETIGVGGGSDIEFTTRAVAHGGTIVWADRAIVWEHVPAERLRWRWIVATARKDGATREQYAHRIGTRDGPRALVARLTTDLRRAVSLEPLDRRAEVVDSVAGAIGQAGAMWGHAPRYYRRTDG